MARLAFAVSASLTAAAVAAPLASLDNEQKGAAAYVTTTFATGYTEGGRKQHGGS